MNNKLLTKHHFEFLSLKGGCTGLSEATLVKMPHCWKSHVLAQLDDNYRAMFFARADGLHAVMLGSFPGLNQLLFLFQNSLHLNDKTWKANCSFFKTLIC